MNFTFDQVTHGSWYRNHVEEYDWHNIASIVETSVTECCVLISYAKCISDSVEECFKWINCHKITHNSLAEKWWQNQRNLSRESNTATFWSCNSKNFLDCCHMLTAAIGFLCIQVDTTCMTKEKKYRKKIAAKQPTNHDDPAAIQVFEAQIHYLTLSLFYLYISL